MPSIANSNPATKQEIRDVAAMTIFADFAANVGTPSVAAGGTFKTANSIATTITNFVGGYNGQRIVIVINDAFTTIDFTASNLVGNGGVDWSPSSGDSFTAVRDSAGQWFCQIGGGSGGSGLYIAKDSDDTSTGKLTITGTSNSTFQLGSTNNSAITGSIGVYGEATGNQCFGVRGKSDGSTSVGVYGESNGSGSVGGYFINTLATGSNIGVYGQVNSASGAGGVFVNDTANVTLSTGTNLISGTVSAASVFNVDKTGKVTAAGGIDKLTTSTGTVSVSAAAAPSTGQVLKATDSSTAIWSFAGELPIGTNDQSILAWNNGAGEWQEQTQINVAASSIYPTTTNSMSCGTSSFAWSTVGTYDLAMSDPTGGIISSSIATGVGEQKSFRFRTQTLVTDGDKIFSLENNTVEKVWIDYEGTLQLASGIITTDTVNGHITITPNGTGNILLGNFILDADQVIGITQDNYVFTYNNTTGLISLETPISPYTDIAGALQFGTSAEAAGVDSLAFGNSAYAGNQGNIAIGTNAIAYSDSIAVNPPYNIAIGAETQAIGDEGCIAFGDTVTTSATGAIGIGRYLTVREENEVRIGNSEATEVSILNGKIVVYEASEEVFRVQTLYTTNIEESTYNLPTAIKGMKYVFENVTGAPYIIDPNGTEYFAGSTAGKYKSLDATGTYMTIECFKTGIWHITAAYGTITNE
jgi:hypothetical protein